MLIRLTADRALKSGRIARKDESVDVPDDEAYQIVWAGDAVPPVRLRYICEMGFVGNRNVVRGDLVDVEVEMYDPTRFHQLVAVVPAKEWARFDGSTNVTHAADEPILLPQPLAVEMVMAGGRYATKEQADALEWVAPTKDPLAYGDLSELEAAGLKMADRKAAALAAVKEAGPVKKVHFLYGTESKSPVGGPLIFQAGEIAEVSAEDADLLIKEGRAEPLVKVRVVSDGLLVGTKSCMRGDVVEVGSSLAEDADRFEPLDGPAAPKGKPVPANRFGS